MLFSPRKWGVGEDGGGNIQSPSWRGVPVGRGEYFLFPLSKGVGEDGGGNFQFPSWRGVPAGRGEFFLFS